MPTDNRVILAIGAGLAILAAVVLALIFTGGKDKTPEAPPAAMGGLTVDLADAPVLDTTRELRCFVSGQYVGLATLPDCARRNGVATDALDVGLDDTGALAAAPTAAFAPPPAEPVIATGDLSAQPQPTAPADFSTPTPAPVASGSPCLRYTGSEWRTVSGGMSLNQCVQALYSGACVQRLGDAQYGRSGDVTLRLVPRRVEQSNDNNHFRVLAEQDRACQFPGLN
jgi:hypothetical protein